MHETTDQPQAKCVVCDGSLPEARMPFACSSCGRALHPSCATRIERGPGWGKRAMFCASCAGDRPAATRALVTE
jgi:hypothetical protein